MQRVLDVALGEVGYREKKSVKDLYSKTDNSGYGNYTKYAKEMSAYSPGIYANGYAWCDTFVDWCMTKAYGKDGALKLIYSWSAYTPTSSSYYKHSGRWHTDAQKGDQIFFKDSRGVICHTGLVYDTDEKYVYTVEGNTSDCDGLVANGGCVAKKRYLKTSKSIAGYGRPDYCLVSKKDDKKEKKMYISLSDCPLWAQPYIKTAIDRGFVKGDTNGSLNLDDDRIWCLVVMMRIAGIMK